MTYGTLRRDGPGGNRIGQSRRGGKTLFRMSVLEVYRNVSVTFNTFACKEYRNSLSDAKLYILN